MLRKMKAFAEIDLGYGDAANYKNNRKYKELFSKVFVKDEKLDRLMREDTYYLIGDKGTGKTAYSVFWKIVNIRIHSLK